MSRWIKGFVGEGRMKALSLLFVFGLASFLFFLLLLGSLLFLFQLLFPFPPLLISCCLSVQSVCHLIVVLYSLSSHPSAYSSHCYCISQSSLQILSWMCFLCETDYFFISSTVACVSLSEKLSLSSSFGAEGSDFISARSGNFFIFCFYLNDIFHLLNLQFAMIKWG